MIVIIGLLVLITATLLAVVGVVGNTGAAHPVDAFSIFGLHVSGLSTGQLFLCGIVVGVVGMLGLSMLLGAFTRRLASRGSRRELRGSRRETTALRVDRDRLTQQLDDERTERLADYSRNAPRPPSAAAAVGTAATPQPGQATMLPEESAAREPGVTEGPGIRQRIRHYTGR